MPILRILRIKIEMEVPFLYMKFWTNQYKNKISPKYMYKNRTFCSQLVFIFLKSVASRQTVQTAVQTTAENTLHSWTPRNNMGTICKKISWAFATLSLTFMMKVNGYFGTLTLMCTIFWSFWPHFLVCVTRFWFC